jgi:hypothetical protein
MLLSFVAEGSHVFLRVSSGEKSAWTEGTPAKSHISFFSVFLLHDYSPIFRYYVTVAVLLKTTLTKLYTALAVSIFACFLFSSARPIDAEFNV